ncbi:GMC family oxidoreductase N-terminal domain-containing protein [Mycobacterium alsense]|uniref:GMC family oxidoreductase N-terminal domain-containing protein n=1 Tax=Mycobacterium alsense TaxID=324058 RepID=UPI003FD81172
MLPALTEHGAHLLDQCRVLRLEADRTHVQQVIAEHHNDTLALKATVVVLAAGALATPVLLLNSRSGDWPNGLANGSDYVGRNLMRHLMDCWPPARSPPRCCCSTPAPVTGPTGWPTARTTWAAT